MPILGLSCFAGKPESVLAVPWRRCCFRLLKLQRDVRENGENPLLPRNCKRHLLHATAFRWEG
jgi:hypothetical protein